MKIDRRRFDIGRRIVMASAFLSAFHSTQAHGQGRRLHRIGYLAIQGQKLEDGPNPVYEAFHGRLRELGWEQGHNVEILYRFSGGIDARFKQYAEQMVREKVDVILTHNSAATRAAMAATQSIPIVFGSAANPTEQKFIASYARPGGNVTGLALLVPELNVKRLELMKAILPRALRFGLMYQADSLVHMQGEIANQDRMAAEKLGVTLQPLPVSASEDFERAFKSAVGARVDAVRITAGAIFVKHQSTIAELAKQHKLLLMATDDRFVDAGALASYGENFPERYRKAAELVDKVLRGAWPGNLPVEYPDTVELVVNLRTAKAIGIEVPRAVLAQARRIVV